MSRFPPPINRNPRLRHIALYQRCLLLCILLQLLLYGIAGVTNVMVGAAEASAMAANQPPPDASPLVASLSIVSLLGLLAVSIFALVQVFKLAQAIWQSTGLAVLLAILMFAPCISLIVLLVVSSKATGELKAAGVHVGLLGVSAAERARLG